MVSVIIPTYNVEKYIEECLDSVFDQTYTDYEVIAINDGSKDSTLSILREYEEKYDKLTVVDIENHGQGYVRNLGVTMASGEYIFFLDSDDIISPLTLEYSVRQIETDGSDLVFFNWTRFDDSTKTELLVNKKPFINDGLLEGDSCRKLYDLRPYYTVENLYRKSFLVDNNLTYGEGYLYEDVLFWLKVCNSARRVSIMKDQFYRIRVNESSSTQANHNSSIHTDSFIRMVEESKKYIREYPDRNFIGYLNYIVNRFYIYHRERAADQDDFAQKFLECLQDVEINNEDSASQLLIDILKIARTGGVDDYNALTATIQAEKDTKLKEREYNQKAKQEKRRKQIEQVKTPGRWAVLKKIARTTVKRNNRRKVLVYLEGFDIVMRYTKTYLNRSKDSDYYFIIQDTVMKKNKSMVEEMRKGATVLKYESLGLDRVTMLKSRFGNIRFDEMIIEDRELAEELATLKK